MLLVIAMGFVTGVIAAPEGVTSINVLSSERKGPTVAANITAQGGNITRITLTTNRQTGSWQGFAGNISGSLVLDDASGDRFYEWSLASISGEVYASRNGSIDFNSVYPHNNCTIDEGLTGTGSDRVNRTYNRSTNTVNFTIGFIQINASSACSTRPYVNSTIPASNLFENLILTAESANTTNQSDQQQGNQSIYAGILQTQSVHGFDGQMYNFQLLVPVDRTARFNTYYFYAELD